MDVMELLRQLRWQDILDIAFVSLLLYRLLLIIKGTRAAQMLIGLGLFLLASLLSGYLELFTINWIIQSFWAQVVIVLIVLFQPEIRRALAQMGEARFLSAFTPAEELKSLDEIVKAAVTLANRKIGALIVIERYTSLGDFVEMGTLLDARVSREILMSIFHPSSPIHDGAVVIRGNRIVAAGCFLPITLSAEMSKDMGTRHRAGKGLTEETDAIALIVSEETGMISMAQAGKIVFDIDMETLRNRLTDIFTHTEPKKMTQKSHRS